MYIFIQKARIMDEKYLYWDFFFKGVQSSEVLLQTEGVFFSL